MSELNYLHPAAMPVEQQMDLLVDDELPEPQRKSLLRSLDQQPSLWRQLSLLFLERQVERSVSRGTIDGNAERWSGAAEPERIAPFHGNWKLSPLKAAGLLILAGISLALTIQWGHGGTGTTSTETHSSADMGSTLNVPLQSFTGESGTRDARVPIEQGAGRPIDGLLQLPTAAPTGMQRHLIFMQDPHGRLIVVQVTPENLQ